MRPVQTWQAASRTSSHRRSTRDGASVPFDVRSVNPRGGAAIRRPLAGQGRYHKRACHITGPSRGAHQYPRRRVPRDRGVSWLPDDGILDKVLSARSKGSRATQLAGLLSTSSLPREGLPAPTACKGVTAIGPLLSPPGHVGAFPLSLVQVGVLYETDRHGRICPIQTSLPHNQTALRVLLARVPWRTMPSGSGTVIVGSPSFGVPSSSCHPCASGHTRKAQNSSTRSRVERRFVASSSKQRRASSLEVRAISGVVVSYIRPPFD